MTRRRYEIAAAPVVTTAFGTLYARWVTSGAPPESVAVYRDLAAIPAIPTVLWLAAS
jgi:hypothetical protein